MFVVTLLSQLLAFGIIAFAIGLVLGRLSNKWLLNSLVCYGVFLLSLSIGTSLVYSTEIQNPFAGFTLSSLFGAMLILLCLLVSTRLAACQS